MKKKIKTGIAVFLIIIALIIILVIAFFELKYRVELYDSPYFQVYGWDDSDEVETDGVWELPDEAWNNENHRFNPPNDKKILCEYVILTAEWETDSDSYPYSIYAIVYSDRTILYGRQYFYDQSDNILTYNKMYGMQDWVEISNLQYFILVQRLKFIDFLKDIETGTVEEFTLHDSSGSALLYYNEDYHLSPKKVNARERALYWTKRYIRQNLLGLDY
jgi:hypothetical protein